MRGGETPRKPARKAVAAALVTAVAIAAAVIAAAVITVTVITESTLQQERQSGREIRIDKQSADRLSVNSLSIV